MPLIRLESTKFSEIRLVLAKKERPGLVRSAIGISVIKRSSVDECDSENFHWMLLQMGIACPKIECGTRLTRLSLTASRQKLLEKVHVATNLSLQARIDCHSLDIGRNRARCSK